jgi:hypothetical protein
MPALTAAPSYRTPWVPRSWWIVTAVLLGLDVALVVGSWIARHGAGWPF